MSLSLMTAAELEQAKRALVRLGYAVQREAKILVTEARHREAVAKRRARLKAEGKCQSCGQREAYEGLPLCAPCGIARRIRGRSYGGCRARKDEGRGKPTVYPGEK